MRMRWRERLPHQPPARLIIDVTADGGVVLDASRGLDRWQLLEGCAQALAVLADGSAGGRLAALSAVSCTRPAAVGAEVVVRGVPGIRGGALQQWQVTAHDQVGVLLSGTVTIARVATVGAGVIDQVPDAPHAVDPLATAALIDDCFPADLPVLAGHFPGAPIIPGVYLLALLERRMGVQVSGISRAKFLHPVTAGERLVISPGRILSAGQTVCVATFTT